MLSRVCNANKQKQKEETAGSSGSSLNQKRPSLLSLSFSHPSLFGGGSCFAFRVPVKTLNKIRSKKYASVFCFVSLA